LGAVQVVERMLVYARREYEEGLAAAQRHAGIDPEGEALYEGVHEAERIVRYLERRLRALRRRSGDGD